MAKNNGYQLNGTRVTIKRDYAWL